MLAFLAAKREKADEVSGVVASLREHMIPAQYSADVAMEIVGTGGESTNTVNISTAECTVAAAVGCLVAKHGNRCVRSNSTIDSVLHVLII